MLARSFRERPRQGTITVGPFRPSLRDHVVAEPLAVVQQGDVTNASGPFAVMIIN